MVDPGPAEDISYEDVADALAILRDIIDWPLAADLWAEVDRAAIALSAAIDAGDGAAVRTETATLELHAPVRGISAPAGTLGGPVPVPSAVRARVLTVIRTLEGFVPVAIFLSDGDGHDQVERSVDQLLRMAGLRIVSRMDPVRGSWFRRMLATSRYPAAHSVETVLHAADARLVLQQDAQNTAVLMQNMGPLITSLQPTKDAVIRVGAFLVVKVDWVVVVHQLTASQQLMLDHSPQLATAPGQILRALGLPAAESGPALPGRPAV